MKIWRYLTVLLIMAAMLSGCSQVYNDLTDTSAPSDVTLTPEYVAEISRELASSSLAAASSKVAAKATEPTSDAPSASETTSPTIPTENTSQTIPTDTTTVFAETTIDSTTTAFETLVPDTTAPNDATVYWTPSGSVWHVNRACSSLKNSIEVISGKQSDAIATGKSRVCKKCG